MMDEGVARVHQAGVQGLLERVVATTVRHPPTHDAVRVVIAETEASARRWVWGLSSRDAIRTRAMGLA